MALLEVAEPLQQVGHAQRHRRLPGTGRPGEAHVQVRAGRAETEFLPGTVNQEQRRNLLYLVLDRDQADQVTIKASEYIIDIRSPALFGEGNHGLGWQQFDRTVLAAASGCALLRRRLLRCWYHAQLALVLLRRHQGLRSPRPPGPPDRCRGETTESDGQRGTARKRPDEMLAHGRPALRPGPLPLYARLTEEYLSPISAAQLPEGGRRTSKAASGRQRPQADVKGWWPASVRALPVRRRRRSPASAAGRSHSGRRGQPVRAPRPGWPAPAREDLPR